MTDRREAVGAALARQVRHGFGGCQPAPADLARLARYAEQGWVVKVLKLKSLPARLGVTRGGWEI